MSFVLLYKCVLTQTHMFAILFLPLQEIDAITTQPSTDEAAAPVSVSNATPPRPEVKMPQQHSQDGHDQQSTEFEYNTQYSLAGGNFICSFKC